MRTPLSSMIDLRAVAVEFDFVNPVVAFGRLLDKGRHQRLDELQTHEHTHTPAIQLACAEMVPNLIKLPPTLTVQPAKRVPARTKSPLPGLWEAGAAGFEVKGASKTQHHSLRVIVVSKCDGDLNGIVKICLIGRPPVNILSPPHLCSSGERVLNRP